MKNFKLLLATGVLFAVASAFTNVNKNSDRPVYGLTPSGWVLADENDRCEEPTTQACKALMNDDNPSHGVESIEENGVFTQIP